MIFGSLGLVFSIIANFSNVELEYMVSWKKQKKGPCVIPERRSESSTDPVPWELLHNDRVQDPLTQSKVPWHAEYFQPGEFEKWHVLERLSDPPLKQVIKLSHTWRKGASVSLRTEGHRQESERTSLAKFPPVYCTWLTPFVLSCLPMTFHSSSNLA